MTKPIRSFPESERRKVAEKRANAGTGGLGQISAENYLARLEKSKSVHK